MAPVLAPAGRRIRQPPTEVHRWLPVVAHGNTQYEQRHILWLHKYADVAEAHVGDHYKFLLTTVTGEFKRIAPYAREVTSSVGNAIVHDPNSFRNDRRNHKWRLL
ncbi:MAG: hypothetical protein CXR31_07870 [Geobacter sp.]|nr:MAG: hypothetical protein CXR31_07870 [Geobacter sp.]